MVLLVILMLRITLINGNCSGLSCVPCVEERCWFCGGMERMDCVPFQSSCPNRSLIVVPPECPDLCPPSPPTTTTTTPPTTTTTPPTTTTTPPTTTTTTTTTTPTPTTTSTTTTTTTPTTTSPLPTSTNISPAASSTLSYIIAAIVGVIVGVALSSIAFGYLIYRGYAYLMTMPHRVIDDTPTEIAYERLEEAVERGDICVERGNHPTGYQEPVDDTQWDGGAEEISVEVEEERVEI